MAAQFEKFRAQADAELSKIGFLNLLEEKTKVKFLKVYLVLGLGALLLLFIILGIFDDFITDVIGTAYPAYVSLRLAMASEVGQAERSQWFTYWVLYALVDSLEFIFDSIGIPLFDLFKTALLVWLWLPQTRGASVVYKALVPVLSKYKVFGSSASGSPAELQKTD